MINVVRDMSPPALALDRFGLAAAQGHHGRGITAVAICNSMVAPNWPPGRCYGLTAGLDGARQASRGRRCRADGAIRAPIVPAEAPIPSAATPLLLLVMTDRCRLSSESLAGMWTRSRTEVAALPPSIRPDRSHAPGRLVRFTPASPRRETAARVAPAHQQEERR